ncbi:SUMF1/EgtB/PvdO family nonheme iron enzyme [Marinovum sp. 2_MG-2023]|nr:MULTISPECIES: SUMF1/EgtB/PvdO family nonheme iron enzyme [unclassified Marinovum]MDO6732631.1 SUMF1/EgtB/PvdO family nonheme iron enzyme [Marinovum sp. 2_MG-2023]MDO6781930.1 SUMF1/EgtB/PvdO family nonheme iron enzyme [Marinovum sp. 1_MG-2023]
MSQTPILSNGQSLPEFLPRLVDFTHEDRAAKGLRVFAEGAAPDITVQFTAFEMVSMHRAQLLHAPRGGGKTVLATQFAAALPDAMAATPVRNPAALTRPAIRNPEGLSLPQVWEVGTPQVLTSSPGQGKFTLARAAVHEGPVLLILDGIEQEDDASALVQQAMDWLTRTASARLLILCESAALETIRPHPDLRAHRLLPLLAPERAQALAPLGIPDPVADSWAEPGLWAASLHQGHALTLAQAAASDHPADWLAEARDAATLAQLSPQDIAQRAMDNPQRWNGPLRHLVAQDPAEPDALARALMETLPETGTDTGGLSRLLAAADLTIGQNAAGQTSGAADISAALAAIVEQGRTPAMLRRRAGAALARLGDPRPLQALTDIPAGRYRMGGDLHPNSAPEHFVDLAAFHIGVYPVTCDAFQRFATDTNRNWTSPPERRNHPATDLTWHDARAYCDWLTQGWRRTGQITPTEVVRLPTEREWEATARGLDGLIWPWGQEWAPEHANDEVTGFNDTCAVGLFPEGASPFGCFDMAGQVWEWCTTLWGDDMTAPGFAFPWAEDGREALDAAPQVRRVLRGGCFSSGRVKANGIYRGSLEPNGFWRGNGFRIVVA